MNEKLKAIVGAAILLLALLGFCMVAGVVQEGRGTIPAQTEAARVAAEVGRQDGKRFSEYVKGGK